MSSSLSVGRLELILGPMFAGKTTEVLRRIDRAKLAGRSCVIMKYSRDSRYSDDNIATHDKQIHIAIPCDALLPHLSTCLRYDLISVDEGQFFSDLIEFTDSLTERGKIVIIAGLDGDFLRRPFGRILELIPKSESIQKLSAVCKVTGGEASFSKRTIDSQELEVIGGSESYSAASRTAFIGVATKGEVHLTLGPVQSGKTTELRRILNRHQIAGRKPILLRSVKGNAVEGTQYPVLTVEKLPLIEIVSEFDTVGVDEGHHFEGIAEWADQLANKGKLVEVSALDGNYDREPFQNIIELVSVCEKLKKLDSVCPMTGLPAPFSALCDGVSLPISRLGLAQVRSGISLAVK
jgi:thymidine kinase